MVNSTFIQFRALLARQQLLQQQRHRRLARRIHDDVSQKLTKLALQLALAGLGEKPPGNWGQKCQDWNTMVVELGSVLRDITNELQPHILDDLGLVAALRWFANSRPEGIVCHLKAPGEPVLLPPVVANDLFAICREIAGDVFAPNGVTEMSIDLEQAPGRLRLRLAVRAVKPEFDPLTFQALDALSIHERLACIDGAAEVDQAQGRDFAVTLSVETARGAESAAA